MKKSHKIEFLSLVEDNEFTILVQNFQWGDPEVQDFVERFSGKEETIRYAFLFLKSNLEVKAHLPESDSVAIHDFILNYAQKSDSRRIRNLYRWWARIAAILIIGVLAGSIVWWKLDRADELEKIARNTSVEATDDAIIVLSDGSKHNLSSKESAIEYNADGTEITVKDQQNEKEKLANAEAGNGTAINQIVVPFGHRHSIVLSDGTKVQLNSGSQLTFPAEFKGKTREVFLKGEGFFEVAKNKEKPFIVKTEFLDMRVLGTSFNVSSYQDEQTVSTVLVEGKVAVQENGKLFRGAKIELKPGQGCFYNVNNFNSQVKDVDVNDFVSWKDGLFRFKDQPLADVIGRVKKYYNKNIQIEGNDLPGTLISGKLVLSEDFEKVMNYLALTLEARYEKENENTYLFRK
ncbi:MAG: FecR domain-containing protein [Prolixibacteraceae bacterium]|nr:FecR domain-containing protein [Prolixibacteraceae bacterium]